jgi:hypothetical protein
LYIDKTQISVSGKLSIYPVQMSLGIFTEKASHYFLSTPLFIPRFTLTFFLDAVKSCRSADAWHPLGYDIHLPGIEL